MKKKIYPQKKLLNSITWLLFISLNFLTLKNYAQEKNLQPSQITLKDLNFDNTADENNLFIYIYIQEEYALTLKQFNYEFTNYLRLAGIQKRIDARQVSPEAITSLRKNYFIQMINNELFYQEELKIIENKSLQSEVERAIARQMFRINQQGKITFEQFLETENLTYAEFVKRIKKDIYIKKFLETQTKFMAQFTPEEVTNLYQNLASKGRFARKFREVYIAELPNHSIMQIPAADTITNLDKFQLFARQQSIHSSSKEGGRIEDVPFIRAPEQQANMNLVSNLFFKTIWDSPQEKTISITVDERQFYIWINKELEKQTQMTSEVQSFIIRYLNTQKRIELEQSLTYKIASSAAFKLRHNNKLVTLDLKKFLKESFAEIRPTDE